MNDFTAHHLRPRASRRSAFRGLAGLGAAAALLDQVVGEGVALVGAAHAQSYPGVQRNQGILVFVPGSSVPTIATAEWQEVNPTPPASPNNRIAATKAALAKAPATASRYESKLYNFPSGSLRVLTFKKGEPIYHQITFETEIYVLQGSATLLPLRGHHDSPVKVNAGDALFLPSGVLSSPKAIDDFVILEAVVGTTSKLAKKSIVTARQAEETHTAQWQKDGQSFNASKPDEFKRAPPDAARWSTKRYVFDGNSIRVATMKKGGRSNAGTNNRTDVLIYLAKGHLRRTEGNQVFDMHAGDATREKLGNSGYWELLEDSVFIATDAPVNVRSPVMGWAIALAGNTAG